MDLMDWFIGFLAGAAGGMGIGGGGILLLYLTAFSGIEQLSAQGINLVFFLGTAPAAIFWHIKNRFIKWKNAYISLVFGIPGVFFGFYIANCIDKTMLRLCFALLLLYIGLRGFLKKEG
ncbi:MAG: TSUP family transporter [Oscillospiraceae bacterium]|nr:TSUP family transporter [Oscillospiraceae bacterium]